MTSPSNRLTRKGLEGASELAGMSLSPGEVEALLQRLQRVHEALAALEELADGEPLPAVSLEDEGEA